MSYDTGETAATDQGGRLQVNGPLQPGDPRTIRATFKVPKGAKKVAITLGGVGTFDDVDARSSRGTAPPASRSRGPRAIRGPRGFWEALARRVIPPDPVVC